MEIEKEKKKIKREAMCSDQHFNIRILKIHKKKRNRKKKKSKEDWNKDTKHVIDNQVGGKFY